VWTVWTVWPIDIARVPDVATTHAHLLPSLHPCLDHIEGVQRRRRHESANGSASSTSVRVRVRACVRACTCEGHACTCCNAVDGCMQNARLSERQEFLNQNTVINSGFRSCARRHNTVQADHKEITR
jgi:hypothetical protein